MHRESSKKVAVIVAHPDDETLWSGGTILNKPQWNFFIVCLSRVKDAERSLKFNEALKALQSKGVMGDMDDGPEQQPQKEKDMQRNIMDLLPPGQFDLVISHNPTGEYTKHLRHEEVSKAVIKLWHTGRISTSELWTFAYEDGNRDYLPRAVKNASIFHKLSKHIWMRKYKIIREIYGFEKNSFEAKTTPTEESFWQFTNPDDAKSWLVNGGILL